MSTANLYVLLSKTLGLGAAPATVVQATGASGFPDAIAGWWGTGQPFVVLTSLENEVHYQVELSGLPEGAEYDVEFIHGDRLGDGRTPKAVEPLAVKQTPEQVSIQLIPRSVVGLRFLKK